MIVLVGELNPYGANRSVKRARKTAAAIAEAHPGAKTILLGRKVALGFAPKGGDHIPPLTIYWNYLTIPHPSGLNRQWHDSRVLPFVRGLLRDFAPDIPWGSLDNQKTEVVNGR
jgi:hypothetical protein